jgi:hypothetical protein
MIEERGALPQACKRVTSQIGNFSRNRNLQGRVMRNDLDAATIEIAANESVMKN